jgi:hypothetical protein
VAIGDADIFLRPGAAQPKDVTLRSPTVLASTARTYPSPNPRGITALAMNSGADAMRRIALPVNSTSWTGVVWTRYDSSTGDDSLIIGCDAAGTGLFLEWKTGVLKLVDTHGFSRPASLGGTAVNGKWYFVGLKVNGLVATIYLGDETTACINTTGAIVAQGGSPSLWFSLNTTPLTGALALAQCYDAQLSDAQVEALRLATSPANAPAGLVGFWPLAGDGTKQVDTSGNGATLTLNSTGPWEETAGPALLGTRDQDTVHLDDATLAASANFSAGLSATLAATLDDAVLAANASTNTASLGKTLGDATLSANAAHGVSMSLGVTLGNATLSANASTVTSSLSKTLGDATLAANASTVTASLAKTLANATLSSSAAHGVAASLAATLGNAALSSNASTVVASLAKTLADATLASSAAHGVAASLSKTLANATLAASASTTVASLAKALADSTLAASAQFGGGVSASLAKTLADATLAASASTTVASLSKTLADAALSAAAAHGVAASTARTLADATLAAFATFTSPPTGVTASLAATLQGSTCIAYALVGIEFPFTMGGGSTAASSSARGTSAVSPGVGASASGAPSGSSTVVAPAGASEVER